MASWVITLEHEGMKLANGLWSGIFGSYDDIRAHLDVHGADADTVTFPGATKQYVIGLVEFQAEVFSMQIEIPVDEYAKSHPPVRYNYPASAWPAGSKSEATASPPTTKILPEVRVDDNGATV